MKLKVRGNWQGTGGRFLFQVKSRGKKRRRGKLWGKEERGTSLEGKVVEVDRVETGGGREGGGDAGRLECGGEAEDGGGGGGRLGGGGARGRCDVFC